MSLWSKGIGTVKFSNPVEGSAGLLVEVIKRGLPQKYSILLEVTPIYIDVYGDYFKRNKGMLSAGIEEHQRISGFTFTFLQRDGDDRERILSYIGDLFLSLKDTYNEEYKVEMANFTVDAFGQVGTVTLIGDNKPEITLK